MDTRVHNANKVAWSVSSWCHETELSKSYIYELIAAGKVRSVKIGGKRLITTPPRQFIDDLAEGEAA